MQEKINEEDKRTEQTCSCKTDSLAENYSIGEYRILNVLSQNGEGITYLAQDSVVGDTVQIREFFPGNMAQRCEDGCCIKPLPECATKFKYFRASFMDLYQTLGAEKENECLIPLIQIVEQNGTVYVVSEYHSVQTLEEYLTQQGGKDCWCKAKQYLLPLYNALSNLHKKGITHQGICPQNILLDEQQHPFLTGFSLSELRTVKGELGSELFDGYSAPEQYQAENWKGTWTDVYSMGAVTYYVLTGTVPPQACERLQEDTLIPAAQLEETVPENVSDALLEAMEPQADKRYENMDVLTGKMLETTSSNTAVFRVEDTQNKSTVHLEKDDELKSQNNGKTYIVITMVATLLILVLSVPKLYQYINDSWTTFSNDFSWEQNSNVSEEKIEKAEKDMHTHEVENFVGKASSDVLSNPEYEMWYHFEQVQEYNEKFEQGVIMKQSVPSGTQIGRKTTVTLYISKGSEKEPLPELAGKTLEEATAILSGMGKQWKVVEGESDVINSGSVFRTEPPAGTELSKGKSEQIILYVAVERDKQEDDQTDLDDDTQILSQKNSDRKVIKKKEKSKSSN